jgi:hypothetical protein
VNSSEQFANLMNARSEAIPRRPVEVQIEELVLHGFAAGDRQAIAEAVRHELSQLIEAGQLPLAHGNPVALKRIDAGAFQVKAGSKPANSGTQIARSVVRGLRREMRAAGRASTVKPGAGGNER